MIKSQKTILRNIGKIIEENREDYEGDKSIELLCFSTRSDVGMKGQFTDKKTIIEKSHRVLRDFTRKMNCCT
jgi:hypothetical protein